MMRHPIPPVYDCRSRVLILGSFPSVKSREAGFFYGHPQNRFWKVLASVTGAPIPLTTEEKRAFLLGQRIALWDVIASCDVTGSADSSIKNAVPNDLTPIFAAAPVAAVFTNGKTADRLYRQYLADGIRLPYVCLPSTSPANAAWNMDRLTEAWGQIGSYLA